MLEIVAAGLTFRARFLEEDAPATVAAFRAILPFDDRIIHCRWSGESNWIPWGDRDLGIGPENATMYPHPGELALYPGGESETELSHGLNLPRRGALGLPRRPPASAV